MGKPQRLPPVRQDFTHLKQAGAPPHAYDIVNPFDVSPSRQTRLSDKSELLPSPAMARLAPFPVILLAQSLSAASEVLGQRVMQRCHSQSSVRMLISMSVYCSVQATVVLGLAELALPTSVTGGQGPLSMWILLFRHPGLWLNAAVNGLYLLSITVLLREAAGPLYVVFAFLCAAVLLGTLSGGAQATSMLGAACLGAAGATLVLWPRDSQVCAPRCTWRVLRAGMFRRFCGASDGASGGRPRTASGAASSRDRRAATGIEDAPGALAGGDSEAEMQPLTGAAAASGARSSSDACEVEAQGGLGRVTDPRRTDPVITGAAAAAPSPNSPTVLFLAVASAATSLLALRHVSVAAAFVVLSLTAAAGISLAAHFQRVADLNGFGYTAIDQVLLPLTALPLAAVLDRSRTLRAWVGEPPWSPSQVLAPSFTASLRRAATEVFSSGVDSSAPSEETSSTIDAPATAGSYGVCTLCKAPWPFVLTLIPYHGLEFFRSFLLFYLVTTFDLDATYLQMTLVRVVLCWVAAMLACTLLREWVGIPRADAERALSPVSLASTCAGSALMVGAVALLRS